MKHIGAVSHARVPDLSSGLKRYALFFDEIQIVGIGPDNLGKMKRFVDAQSIDELAYLDDAGLLAKDKISAACSLAGLTDLTRIPYNASALRIAIAQAQRGKRAKFPTSWRAFWMPYISIQKRARSGRS